MAENGNKNEEGIMGGTNDVFGGGNGTRKSKISYYYDEDFSVF